LWSLRRGSGRGLLVWSTLSQRSFRNTGAAERAPATWCGPASASDLHDFRTRFLAALDVIRKGAPNASLFVVSQFGSPGPYAHSLTASERRNAGGGTGPCDFIDPAGAVVPAKIRVLDKAIHGYEAQLAAGCKIVPGCRYDGGALGNIIDQRKDYSSDLNHLSVEGHARTAAVAWAAFRRAGLVPK
jgi:hypothetical protein